MRILRWIGIYTICFLVVLFVRLGLWTSRYQKLRAMLVKPCSANPQPERRDTVARIVRAVSRSARFIPDASCLTQSISAQALLSWKGIPSTISMGVLKDEVGELKVHAWLVWNGTVVLEGTEDTVMGFSKILELPTTEVAPAP